MSAYRYILPALGLVAVWIHTSATAEHALTGRGRPNAATRGADSGPTKKGSIIADHFTEQFTGDYDLSFRSLWFVPDGSTDFYTACSLPAAYPPTDPAGGIVLKLGDDASVPVTLSGGATVSLYGTAYSEFHIGSNGYITLTTGDIDDTETLADHFALPRISALFHDLDPSFGGAVSWKQLWDRVVVTWEDVPEFGIVNANTFQIEMYFDGRIRISYLSIAAQSGIAGLSQGQGLPIGFIETDLSAFNSNCVYVCLVQLEGLTTTVERDVTFVLTDCTGMDVATKTATAYFSAAGLASVTLMNVNPSAQWITADEAHTLRRRLPLGPPLPSGVDFTGPHKLLAGDLTGDNMVDVEDLSVLASYYDTAGDVADINGDGMQDATDYAAILANFFLTGDTIDGCPP